MMSMGSSVSLQTGEERAEDKGDMSEGGVLVRGLRFRAVPELEVQAKGVGVVLKGTMVSSSIGVRLGEWEGVAGLGWEVGGSGLAWMRSG